MLRRLILFLLVGLLFFSCSLEEGDRMIISSPDRSLVYIFQDGVFSTIDVDASTLRSLSLLSSKDEEETLKLLFPGFEYYERSYEDTKEVRRILRILKEESGAEDLADALRRNEDIIEKSRLLAKIDGLSNNIDEEKLLSNVASSEKIVEYDLANICSFEHSFEENRLFIESWLENILR